MGGFRYLVWVQTERPDTLRDDYSISTKIEEKTNSLDQAKRQARMWASRERVLSARVWDSAESVWTYDAFEEFDLEREREN